MNKLSIIVIYSVLLFCCSQTKETPIESFGASHCDTNNSLHTALSQTKIFTLRNSDSSLLVNIYGKLPSFFDTTYSWFRSSDDDCSGSFKHRAHSKEYRVVKETGWLYSDFFEKGLYLTISHSPHFSCDTFDFDSYFRNWNLRIKEFDNETPEIDTNQIFNSHKYFITTYNKFIYNPNTKKRYYFNSVSASVLYKKRLINIDFQSNIIERDSLRKIAYAFFKTLQFN